MSEQPPKKSKRFRNLLLFVILIGLFSCYGLSQMGSGASSTTSNRTTANTSSSSSRPTSTPVRFDPIRLSGRGDDVVRLDKPDVPAIITLTHSGSRNFVVTNYDGNGSQIDLLVNEIGNYNGTRPLDFGASELTERLEIQADGSWTVLIEPISEAKSVRVPTTNTSGQGDMVLLLSGSSPDTAEISHTGESNFVVQAYGNSRRLLVNEIGNYSGTVIVPQDTLVLEIVADGRWQIAIDSQ